MLLQAAVSPYSSKIRRFPADSSGRSRKKKPREPDFTAGIQTPRPPVSFLSVLGDGDGTVGEKKRRSRWRREKRMGPESPDKGPLMWVN